MDLNHFYSQHQIALMRAESTTSASDRDRYLDCASGIARQIGSYQQARGAKAGALWHKDRHTVMLTTGTVR